jgi:hypothetical protein
MRENNFQIAIDKCENLLNMSNIQKLTLKGKVLIVNTLILPQLLYVSSVMSPPPMIKKKLKDMITKFIWSDKPAKVKYSTMINSIEKGGLKLQDFECKLKSLKLKWIKAMCDKDTNGTWKEYMSSYSKQNISQIMTHNKVYNDHKPLGDDFYDHIMEVWADIHYYNPTKPEDIIEQMICNNSLIKIEHTIISEKRWPFENIKNIKDIIDDRGQIASRDYLANKFNVNIPIMTYNSVISAIPIRWKKIISEDPNILNYRSLENYSATINDTRKKIIEYNTKDLYWHYINNSAKRPTSENTWEDKVGLGFTEEDWARTYLYAYKLTKNTRILAFHFKLSHRTLACNEKLFLWKITETDKCKRCLIDTDGFEHHLVACPKIKPFWDALFTWWKSVMQMFFPINTYDILFGLPNPNKDKTIDHLNFTTLHAMYYIYTCNRKEMNPELYNFLLELKNTLHGIKICMTNDNKETKFDTQWGELLDSFNPTVKLGDSQYNLVGGKALY